MLHRLLGLLLVCSTTVSGQTNSPAPKLLSVKKIWHGDKHNAFTDLTFFKGEWFCTFRESAAHVGGNGKIRVLNSKDGDQWKSAALVSEEGIDLRDPKLSVTPDQRLMLSMGGSVYEGRILKGRQSRSAFSKDGRIWTAPQRILKEGDWLWRVTWHKGVAYGVAISSGKPDLNKTNYHAGFGIRLVASDDGVNFHLITRLDVPDAPNESTVRFQENGDMIALVRRELGDKQAWIGHSSPPYTNWTWHPSGCSVGGPNFILLDDGRILAGGRQTLTGENAKKFTKTFIGHMTLQAIQPELLLPSGGDCSYPGLVWHDGVLWASYYSSHEGGTDIYLAKVQF